MLLATAAAFVLSTSAGVKPNTYSQRWLCDLWAGAQCYATACQKDGKARCEAVSKQCQSTGESTVDASKAERKAACARALLKSGCGAATPPECDGLM